MEENVEVKEIIKTEEKKLKINLPNKLTILRMIMVPLFVIAMALISKWDFMKYVALGLYVVASLTDFIDGKLARKYNLITTFGKLMDPLADKMLVSAGFIMLTGMGIIPAWITVIIVLRDFLITTVRQFGTASGETISAGMSGKIKTAFQMVGVSLCIIDTNPLFAFIQKGARMARDWDVLVINVVASIAIGVALIFTIWSCIEYLFKYKKYINATK